MLLASVSRGLIRKGTKITVGNRNDLKGGSCNRPISLNFLTVKSFSLEPIQAILSPCLSVD